MRSILQDISDFIFLADLPQESDLIFIPGNSQWEPAALAADLYHQGLAPFILPSGKFAGKRGRFANEDVRGQDYAGNYPTEFAFCRHILLDRGVPAEAILCEDQATNTMENACFSAGVIREYQIQIKRAIICCQSFHARRCFQSYAAYFPQVEFLTVPVDTWGINRENWYKEEDSYQLVMEELEKCGRYFTPVGDLLAQQEQAANI